MEKKINNADTHDRIGFNDGWVLLLLLPSLAFIIPIVFFGLRFQRPPYYTWRVYLTTLIITVSIALGNRVIMIFSRKRYPLFKEIRKRLTVQIILMLFYTFIATNVMGYLLDGFCGLNNGNYIGHTLTDILINSNSASLFCSITVVAIYESIYFIEELKQSVEEKEMLKRESLQAQLTMLLTQVNPHFLFNNLNTLCSIIPEEPVKSVDFVKQLSKVYRHILEVKSEKCIPLREEMEVLKAYSFLLKTRFDDSLVITINVDETLMSELIVPFSLQLLMENAMKHNIASGEKPLKIVISSVENSLTVSNTLQKKNQPVESTGIGLNYIRNRYKIITNLPVTVTESDQSFTVSIPLIKNHL